jgi:hypothetical protein
MSEGDAGEQALAGLSHGIYTPLQPWETRLIELLPGAFGDDIECRLQIAVVTAAEGLGLVNDNRQQAYEAISYTWGYPELTARVVCNGSIMYVPPPLATALRYLRRAESSRYLWCDALCINQADLAEKAIQVQAIWRIFDKAHRVVGWLGEFDSLTVAKLQQNENLIFDLPYFSRCWVRAETVRIKNVVFQYNHKTLNPFIDPHNRLILPVDLSAPLMGSTEATRKRVLLLREDHKAELTRAFWGWWDKHNDQKDRQQFSGRFAELMLSNAHFECTDRKDGIYSFASRLQSQWAHVLDDHKCPPIEADYSISFEQLQQVVVKFLINALGDYRLLEWFRSADSLRDCSWLPSWDEHPISDARGRPSALTFESKRARFSSGRSFVQQHLSADGRLLLGALLIGFCHESLTVKVELARSQWLSTHQEYVATHGPELRCWSLVRTFNGKALVLDRGGVAEPGSAQRGDAIVVPAGGDTPCVIRPTKDGTHQFVSYARWLLPDKKDEHDTTYVITESRDYFDYFEDFDHNSHYLGDEAPFVGSVPFLFGKLAQPSQWSPKPRFSDICPGVRKPLSAIRLRPVTLLCQLPLEAA